MGKVYKQLLELGNIITGKTPSTEDNSLWDGDIPFITPTDIDGFDSCYQGYTERTISVKGAKKQPKTILPPNTVCVSCIATIGKMCLTRVPSITNQQINSIVPNKENDYRYLLYMLRYNLPYMELVAGGSGSGTPIISKSKFSKFKFEIEEDLSKQHYIASILSAYDDLIEKNNRKIAILQEMAEEIYKEWFVRFRFPKYKSTKFKNSSLGRIPQDFEVVKITNVFDYHIGGGWGNEEENKQYNVPAYVIRGTDFPYVTDGKLSTCPYRWHKESNFKSRQLKSNDIIIEISGGTDEQPVGRTLLIDTNIISRLGNKVICASFCKLVRVKQDKISPIYFNYWMKFLYDTKTIERFQLQSTGIINFKFDYFVRKGDVLLPPKKLMEKFDSIISPMRENIGRIAEQNNNLKTQRDLLLPRLMSGKLEVKV